jgi:hypothetical protein
LWHMELFICTKNYPVRFRRQFRIFSFTRSGRIFSMKYSWMCVWSSGNAFKLTDLFRWKNCQHNLARLNCLLFSWNDIFLPIYKYVTREI